MIFFFYIAPWQKKQKQANTSVSQNRALRQVQYSVAMTVATFHVIHEKSDETPDQIIQRED